MSLKIDKSVTYFSKSLPLGLVNNDKQMNYSPLFDTYNVKGRINSVIAKNEWSVKPGSSDELFNKRQGHCESVGSGDQFDHLSSLAATEDTASRLRCGWVYNNLNPDNGRGAYGISDGPLKTSTQGQWMWNLKKAKEKYHTSICQKIQSCSDIDSDIYKKRCGWCSRSGKAVPVAGGALAYPAGANTSCPSNNLVLKSAQCPPHASITDPNYVRTPAEACIPYANGALPRNCIIQKVIAAGCSDRGTIAQALSRGSDNDYMSALSQERAFKLYQERTAIPIDTTAIKTGKITITDALNTFSKVQDLAASDANGGLQFAARDLCLNKGAIDEYDFCLELKDATVGPFDLDCLQKQFMRMGGQKSGTSYPNGGNIGFYNNLGNWGAVKRHIQALSDKTKSTFRPTQQEGMIEFYGIRLQNKRHPLPYGPEIAWKDRNVKLSCQRPVGYPQGYANTGCIDDESDDMLEKWAGRNGWKMGMPPEIPFRWYGNGTMGGPQHQMWEVVYDSNQNASDDWTAKLAQAYDKCETDQNCLAVNVLQTSGQRVVFSGTNNIDSANARPKLPTGSWGGDANSIFMKVPMKCSTNPPKTVAGWHYQGCWKDDPKRTLPTRLPNTNSTEECIRMAKDRGFNAVGRQYFGECWAGYGGYHERVGRAGCCETNGGAWTNQVYTMSDHRQGSF